MTPAEALEQVRALAESWRFKGKGAPDDMPDQFDEYADSLAHEVLAILDAVTPDAPVTVETVEELEALPVGTGVLPAGGVIPAFRMSSGEPAGLDWCAPGSGLGYTAHEIRLPAVVLAPATPERTEQERGAAVERVARALHGDACNDEECDHTVNEWEREASIAVAAHEGREVSE